MLLAVMLIRLAVPRPGIVERVDPGPGNRGRGTGTGVAGPQPVLERGCRYTVPDFPGGERETKKQWCKARFRS